MGRPIISALRLPYSDNESVTVAERLLAELQQDPTKLDVASGYLTPSVWTLVGSGLLSVGRFRLLLGKDFEMATRSRRATEADIHGLIQRVLQEDLEAPPLPTPEEAEAIQGWLAYLARPDTEVDVRVWVDGFLHAKAYLPRTSAGVGSANFTTAGLTTNRELVAWREDRSVLDALQVWFDTHWQQAEPYKETLRAILANSRFGTRPYTPYDVLIRTLAERYGTELPPSLEAARFSLKWFQEDAVFRLIKLLQGPAHGALLADAVGLGKTFMALGVIHHFLYEAQEKRRGRGRPVLIMVPASMAPTWTRELEGAGLDWACHLITLQSLREATDLTRYYDADLVVVDEAHRLRGGGGDGFGG